MQETSRCLPFTHVCSYSPLQLGLRVLPESAAMLACLSKRKRGAEMALHRGRMNLCARDRSWRSVFVCACLCVLRCVHMMHEMPVMMMVLSVQMMRSIHDMLVMMKMGHSPFRVEFSVGPTPLSLLPPLLRTAIHRLGVKDLQIGPNLGKNKKFVAKAAFG